MNGSTYSQSLLTSKSSPLTMANLANPKPGPKRMSLIGGDDSAVNRNPDDSAVTRNPIRWIMAELDLLAQ